MNCRSRGDSAIIESILTLGRKSAMPLALPTLADIESSIATTTAEILKLASVESDDNLLELGVDSLVGTRIVVALRSRFDVEVPLLTLFENPVVADFARAVLDIVEDARR
jgi:acyl carrier protein